MQAEHRPSIHLTIPFYRQHYDFTCGPACLMMAMKYLDAGQCFSKEREIDIWREANLVAVCGTSRYGLAFSAAVRGFSSRVTSSTGGTDFVEKFVPPLDDHSHGVARRTVFGAKSAMQKTAGPGTTGNDHRQDRA